LDRFGKVDTLVSVVGIRPHKPFWEFGHEELQEVFAVNLFSTFYLAKAVAPGMMQRKSGAIIALGGRASLRPEPEGAPLVASKHGLYGLIKSLALELGPHGVRANLIALSHIENKRLNPEWYAFEGGNPDLHMDAATPMGRAGSPAEVANVALFLASDASSYITGDYLCCAGGRQL
jgi:3-oxoacyl-[acyl-carrier protein] reductase